MRLGMLGLSSTSTLRDLGILIQPSLLLKLLVLPAIMLALAIIFRLPIVMRDALVLQAATPTAISVLLIAEASGKDQDIAASLVVWST